MPKETDDTNFEMDKKEEEERIFEPDEYPITINIYDAFLKFELTQQHLIYGIEPEDWYPSYLLFAAGFMAGFNTCSDIVIASDKRSKTDG